MIHFKTPRQKDEFYKIDARLKAILLCVAGFAEYYFSKDITITHLLRTQEEQDRYYGNKPEYQANPWRSVHQEKRGADVRSRNFTEQEAQLITDFVNVMFHYDGKKSCLHHNIGLGSHFHIQVKYEKQREYFI